MISLLIALVFLIYNINTLYTILDKNNLSNLKKWFEIGIICLCVVCMNIDINFLYNLSIFMISSIIITNMCIIILERRLQNEKAKTKQWTDRKSVV